MAQGHLTIEDEPDERDRRFLEERIYDFNVAATGIADGRLLAIYQRDEQGAIVGGLFGWTWGGCLEVEYLWVREDQRGRRLGTRLLVAAEEEARRRGCRQAILSTHSFQAPRFYERMGYEVYGVAENYPHGHKQYHLRKIFR